MLELNDIIRDRLSVTVDKLEEKRPGIIDRAIQEAQSQLGYKEDPATDLEKLHVGLFASLKLGRAAIDLYQEDLQEEQADDVRRQYQDRIAFLKQKFEELEKELAEIKSQLTGDPGAKPPCFDIKKSE
jgi:phage shock protein A